MILLTVYLLLEKINRNLLVITKSFFDLLLLLLTLKIISEKQNLIFYRPWYFFISSRYTFSLFISI